MRLVMKKLVMHMTTYMNQVGGWGVVLFLG